MPNCEVCGRYSDKFNTDEDVTTHMKATHPNDPRTSARIRTSRTTDYGSQDVGKVKPPSTPIPTRTK